MIGEVKDTDYKGSISFAPNELKRGDTFSPKMSGIMTSSNGDRMTIRGFMNFGPNQQRIFEINPIALDSLNNGYWELELEFVMRLDGTSGQVLSSGNFQMCQNIASNNNSIAGTGYNGVEPLNTFSSNIFSVNYTGNIDSFICFQSVLTKIH